MAGSGVQGLTPCGRAPARCTSWSARSARPLPAPSVLSPAPQLRRLKVCARRARTPQAPPHQRQVSPSWTAPALTPQLVHFASASVAVRLPPLSPSAQRRGYEEEVQPAGTRRVHTPEPRHRPLHNFLPGRRPGVPPAELPAHCSPPAAGGGAASDRPGRDCARAGGVGVRQGGTALNALDSPAPALSPPSSTDSWGLCFLHPPGRLRSAPTAARDSPSATAAAPLVHPGEPGQRHPVPSVRRAGGDPSPGHVRAGPR